MEREGGREGGREGDDCGGGLNGRPKFGDGGQKGGRRRIRRCPCLNI